MKLWKQAGAALVLLSALVISACAGAPQTKDAIRDAILNHLKKRDDMMATTMNIDVVSVSFRDKEADAVVSVTPKAGGGGIQMTYNLAAEGREWVVRKSGANTANPHGGMPPQSGLPAGHPPVSGQSSPPAEPPAANSPHGQPAPPQGKK